MLILLAMLAAQTDNDTAVQPAFEPMAFLVGHCWEGKFEGRETDTHCFDAVYGGQHIRDRHEVTGGQGVYRGETVYSRDGQVVSYTYWNSLGGVSRGSMKGAGEKLDFGVEHHRTKDGRDIAITTQWQRKGDEAYEAVTASQQMPSMNRTVTYRLVPETVSARIDQAPDGTQTLSHQVALQASPEDVWKAVATADGWKSWAVPIAWMEADVLETSYSPAATRGDESTIRQKILRMEPGRSIAFRTTKAPKGFPHFESFARVTHVIELDPLPDGRTRVRLTGAGYPRDEAGRQLVMFFTEGNRISLERLQRRFAVGPIDWTKEQRTAAK